MPANYCFSDLQLLLPFVPTDDDAPFPWQAGDGHVQLMADDRGLWLRVPDDTIISAVEFEVITGFRWDELERKKAGSFYIYTLKDGAPLLPFPFTAAQLQEVEKRTCIFSSNSNYYGDKTTDELIAEIAQDNPKAAELARAVVYGELPTEEAAMPAPVVGAGASDSVDPDNAEPLPLKAESVPDLHAPLIADRTASNTVESAKTKRRTWRDVTWLYMVKVVRTGQYKTAKDFYRALECKAGTADSPFDLGTGPHRNALFVREISETLTLKTVQNYAWRDLKASRKTV